MTAIFIICPYTLLDIIDEKNNWYIGRNKITQILMELLVKEKERISTPESKRYRLITPKPIHDILIDLVVEVLNEDKEKYFKQREILETLFAVIDREGTLEETEDYFESIFELAREFYDEFDVFIVSHYKGKVINARERIIKKMKKDSTYFDKFKIVDIEETTKKIIERMI